MQSSEEDFVDLLKERRKDWDILWVSRPMNPLLPHKLSSELIYTRKQAIENTLANSRVIEAIHTAAVVRKVPVSTIVAEAQDILEEMASKAHLPTVRWIGLFITKVLKRVLISIRINESLLFKMKDQMSNFETQYVYAPTHRSYLDFILLSYILFSYDMALPNIASGMDFYRMKIVGELLRKTGAFYMRRTFSTDPLYKEIFKAYVGSLVIHSDRALEFFIEGTRSRSQKTLSPKFGLLSTVLDSLFKSSVPDVQFIPISISYDKPLEELLFVYELLGVPKPAESTSGLFRSLSILHEPFAHGNVYVKIASPISALDYLDSWTRQESALSPHAKLPPHITKRVAYAIVDCHKRNTVLTPFNLISILYNERIHSHPRVPYSMEELFQDYKWLKEILIKRFKALINPQFSNIPLNESTKDENEQEILESLQTHKNLMELDIYKNLRLKRRHTGVSGIKNVKGYALGENTLRISVPVVNLMIYVNPVFAYLSKPCIAVLCINVSPRDLAVKRYSILRRIFSEEFALRVDMTEPELIKEYEEVTEFLHSITCSKGNELIIDEKFYSVLYNLLLPFVKCLHVLCDTLLQWENSVSSVDKNIIKECQRRIELSFYDNSTVFKHPYCLSLDIYGSLLSSLVATGNITLNEQKAYKPNNMKLEEIVIHLNNILSRRPHGSYLDISSSLMPEEMPTLQAKL